MGKTMYPGSRVVDWKGRTLSRGLSPRRRETEAQGWFSPRGVQEVRQARMSARRKPGIPPSPQEPRPGLEGGCRRAQEGVGRRRRLHHEPPGGAVEPLQVLVHGAQGLQEVGERPALPRAVHQGEEPPRKNTNPTTNPR